MSQAVVFDNVDIVFGKNPDKALPLIDAGRSRDEIARQTKQVLGVAGASLTVEEGEIVVLMGLSGSGKSTLLRAVNGLAPVQRGLVRVRCGDDVVEPYACSRKALRALRSDHVSMVFQQFALLPWRTVADNVGFGLELSGVADKERRSRVAEQLELVGLTEWAGRRVNELSGGMQQRVGLARALTCDPEILLMDEPLGALDAFTRENMQELVLQAWDKTGKIVFFITHSVEEALFLASKLIVMSPRPGRITHTYELDFARRFLAEGNARGIKSDPDFIAVREEVLAIIHGEEVDPLEAARA